MRNEVIVNCHNSNYAAHPGVQRTMDKIRDKFYWYKMIEDVKSHIQKCENCNRWKSVVPIPKAALSEYRVGYPLDCVGIDVIGPLPRTKKYDQYILVKGDHFTRWMEAFPIPNQTAEKIGERIHC